MSSTNSLLILFMVSGLVGAARAGEDSNEFKQWVAYYQHVAESYQFSRAGDARTKFMASAKPLMTYAHPAGDTESHGAFFVWTLSGRPEVVGSIWSHGRGDGSRDVVHEFHSLSTEALSPVQVGYARWTPQTGIPLKTITDAARPKDSTAIRLAQMRSLAREFTGYSTPHGREERLRTLEQPLYRYEGAGDDVLDGAVFGMFRDWDPDIMLLIEARKSRDGFVWHYGIGRFNGCPLRLQYKDVDVWKEGKVPLRAATSNFFAVVVGVHRISEP